jgi:hypothetical protein
MSTRRKIAAGIFAALLGLGIGLGAASSGGGTAHAGGTTPSYLYHG